MNVAPKPKLPLCWISQRPVRFESQRYQTITGLLKQHHYDVKWLEAPHTCPTQVLQQWVAENIPNDAVAIFYGDKDLLWFKEIMATVKALTNTPLAVVPFFWVYEDVDQHLLGRMCEVGFDDFFHLFNQPHELLFRLKLRLRNTVDRLKLDTQIKESNLKIARSETILKQREEFLNVCAHDLRSPLGLIQSSVGMVLNQGSKNLNPTQSELLTRAKRQATQAISLVNDLLDVMSFEQGLKPQYKMFNLHEFLSEFHRDYHIQAEEKGVGFHYENGVQDWRVFADTDRIRQLLQNLFGNALKFTERGKNIYLGVNPFQGRRKLDPPYPMIIISLRDEGQGIPQKELQKIFDRFTQIKEHSRPEGRGLGLTVAKQISTLHDGNIWVESTEGKGSTFYVLFPHVISRVATPTPEERPKQKVILVAEPSEERREAYFKGLEEQGYQMIYARDGVEALSLLFHWIPDYFVMTANLSKMEVTEVALAAKGDVLTSQIPLYLALEETETLHEQPEKKLFDHFLKLPLTQKDPFKGEGPSTSSAEKKAA
jgi:two-component system, sensor histidine kinase and response regulator